MSVFPVNTLQVYGTKIALVHVIINFPPYHWYSEPCTCTFSLLLQMFYALLAATMWSPMLVLVFHLNYAISFLSIKFVIFLKFFGNVYFQQTKKTTYGELMQHVLEENILLMFSC